MIFFNKILPFIFFFVIIAEFSQEDLLFLQKEQKRNSVISLAYLEDGYSQIEIANHLGLSKSAISMVIKNGKNGN